MILYSFDSISNPLVYDLTEVVSIHMLMTKTKSCFDIKMKLHQDVIISSALTHKNSIVHLLRGPHCGLITKIYEEATVTRRHFDYKYESL